ncbi:hypothetical protein FH039_05040 [Thermococcus indicus]|uniref:Uncharacterized protein n=1 Tax=Thermococcus indicus TaxID=2586643 RepID=A0A4Y5SJY1_9EURY|nr:hypothetical protein [Thermococcus indicus]QDA31095.1 hypothetical protein FH039_05040 [Thermococcus indicus]
MELKAKVESIISGWMDGKRCTYARVRCEILSNCTRPVERALKSIGMRFTRLTDPDPYLLVSSGEDLYDRGKFLTVIELTDGLGRLFYLAASDVPVSLKEIPHPEFVLAFRVKRREGFRALLDVIGRKRIGGIRHKHRSLLNFLISFVGSLLLSSAVNIEGYWGQATLMLLLALAIFIILDYPFSLLYIKGVEVIQNPEPSAKVFVIKVKRAEKKRSS